MKATNGERGEEVNGRKKEQTLGRPTSAALAASSPVEAGGGFFIFIFFISVFYKNIFSILKFTDIYPGRPAAGRPDLTAPLPGDRFPGACL